MTAENLTWKLVERVIANVSVGGRPRSGGIAAEKLKGIFSIQGK